VAYETQTDRDENIMFENAICLRKGRFAFDLISFVAYGNDALGIIIALITVLPRLFVGSF